MKKIIALIIAIVTVFALAACTTTGKKEVTMDNVKIGVICLHDENSTYDANFINAVKAVQAKLGLKDEQVVIRTGVDESDACYKAAADMADSGCDIVFADSFGHESYMVQAAKEFPNVEFCHATGVSAKVQNIKNFHNAFASIYEGRFLAGIAAGMKLNEMISSGKITSDQAKIGYVGAWPYAEVISGYTSFFLGARYICPSATMKVVYTNAWFDIAKEKESAESLIKDGCVLISQHADSEGAPKACQAAGVPNIAYNVDTTHLGPDTAIISSKIDWEPYFELIINAVVKGEAIPTDYCGDFSTGSVALTKLNDKAAAPGTAEKISEIEAKLKSGEIKVFATDSFKVKGETLSEYKADVDGDNKGETNVIHDGYFDESNAKDFRSAPYFDIIIDGITVPEA
ncbi:MAG: BMP family ABC transporter substrate-binding protein [Clostridia bacterium]|nr:BMP family ABC transporter substrate-binding protein [Clostridia bacterium]